MEFEGLTQKRAEEKLKEFGYNEIEEISELSPIRILFRQIRKNLLIYLLTVAMIISFFVGKSVTGYAILLVLSIVILVGFIQEYRAEKAIKTLKKMVIPISTVLRDSKEIEIPAKELVPGDIVILRNGEKIPADCIVLKEKDLTINESILTGESTNIKKKSVKDIKKVEKENMLYMGTFITDGKCIAKVMHTGMNTEFGKIAKMISSAEKEMPLQNKINNIAKYMSILAVSIAIITGLVMLTRVPLTPENIIEALIVVIAISVSAVPEGLPVVLITTLATGAYNMAKKNAIVNRLSVIETLGETTVICTDKTGTITKGQMTVKRIYTDNKNFKVTGSGYDSNGNILYGGKIVNPDSNDSLKLLIKTGVLCNDSSIEEKEENKEFSIHGLPTEAALLILGAKSKIFKEDYDSKRIEEIPFNSERKMMITVDKERSGVYVHAKGAPEVLINKCKYIKKNGKIVKFTQKEKEKVLSQNEKMTSDSLRTLALAYKKTYYKTDIETDLIFLGLVGIQDPPRDEVKGAIKICKKAGIEVKMITGDNKETAEAIGKQIGLKGNIITGKDLDKITDDELSKIVDSISIFARVKPEHKIRIVKALKKNNEIVTMTGDGVNDAPALKESHIGVAMGKTGTDVTRESSDIVLKDDNFATIVEAIKEGRTIFNNIRKFVTYQLSCNYAELTIIFIGILLGLPLPLLALQILFVNLVTDDMPAITLGLNPKSKNVMRSKPRKNSSILDKPRLMFLLMSGTVTALGTLAVFSNTLATNGEEVARTTGLVTLIMFEIFNAFNYRSFKTPNYKMPFNTNRYLIYASIASIFFTILVIYTPINVIFETVPIGINNWMFALSVSISTIIIMDSFKSFITSKKIINLD